MKDKAPINIAFLRGLVYRPANKKFLTFLNSKKLILTAILSVFLVSTVISQTTYYTYQSGSWAVAATWTTDPSGTLSVNPAVPGTTDNVVILNGRSVYITANNLTVASLEIKEGGTLDLRATTGHNFGNVLGQGLLRLQTNNFPLGTFTSFVSATGGTIEYYNTASFNFSQLIYNNLVINLSANNLVSTVAGNMTINGDLTIIRGRFQINNGTATSRTITVGGDVDVSANGGIQLGTAVM